MDNFFKKAVVLFCATIFPGLAMSAPDGELDSLLQDENQVFAASRYKQTLAETPANVSILTRDDIRRFGYRSIKEALNSLPGFYDSTSQWPALGLGGVAVPGDFGSRILYMVNGMPIYEPTYGGFFIEYLDMDSIDRIEVVRGTGSALYGSGAVLGLVNLITRSGRNTPAATVSLEAKTGSADKKYAALANLSKTGVDSFFSLSQDSNPGKNLFLREYASPAYQNGISFGAGSMNDKHLFGRVEKEGAWAQALVIDSNKHDPLASYGTVFNSNLFLREKLSAVETGINRELDNEALLTGRLYFFDIKERGDYFYSLSGTQAVGSAAYLNVSDLMSSSYGGEIRYDQFLADRHHLLAGVEAKQVDGNLQVGNQPGFLRAGILQIDTRPSYTQFGFYGQDEIQLSEAGKLFFGVRLDDYRSFSPAVKSHWSPRIAYVHSFSETNTGKIVYGEAFRVPTIYESQYQDGLPGAVTLWANPLLKPEITRRLEAIWESAPSPQFNWSLNAFLTQLKDSPVQVITPVLNGIPCQSTPATLCLQYQNSGLTQEVVGFDASFKKTDSDGFGVYGSATLERGIRKSDGAPLASSPDYLLKGGVSHSLWAAWTGAIDANFVGRARGRINADGSRTADAPAYLLLNANVSANFEDSWRAALRAYNLLDRATYTVASRELFPVQLVPGSGRTFMFTLGKDF